MAIFRVPFLITFPGAGSPGANIWHIRTADPGFTTELMQANQLIGYLRTFYNSLSAYYPTTTVITVGTVTEEGTAREIIPTMTPVSGGGTGSMMQALALVATWKTTIAARRGRGRTFIGPLSTGAVQNDGTPDNTFLNTARTAAAALVVASAGYGNGAVGVYGYNSAKTPGKNNPRDPSDAKVFRDITGYNIRDLFGVLRSRRD
jgi:hypothetical protein